MLRCHMAQVNKLIDVGGHEKNVGPMWSVDAESIKRDSSWSLLKEHLSNFRSNPDDFYRWLTPVDEVWIYYFESEAKKQSMGWKHHGSHVPREFLQQFRSGKIASSVFWDNEGFSWVTVGNVDSHYRWLPRHPVKKNTCWSSWGTKLSSTGPKHLPSSPLPRWLP